MNSNGGKTLRDAVDRIENKVARIAETQSDIVDTQAGMMEAQAETLRFQTAATAKLASHEAAQLRLEGQVAELKGSIQ